jgi:addiction module HigA family antidote
MPETARHPGQFIREQVLPKGMTVSSAAKLIGVGRPALSNMLNGKAALSAEMASKLELAFKADAKRLLDMQAAFDATQADEKNSSKAVATYSPPFLQLKADDIVSWAARHNARSRLAVFIRNLVNSTGRDLSYSDFPGNDDSERPGWDGQVTAGYATPWVPEGKSGWEFGCNANPTRKANEDYEKSVEQNSLKDRAETTFVFVTPRRWPKKNEWADAKRQRGEWKAVRVFDASDLEQWLEHSVSGQAWFAHEIGAPSNGVRSLDQCWADWTADCEPKLPRDIFSDAVRAATPHVKAKLEASPNDPIVVTADSTDEALAFLSCLFSPENDELAKFGDRIAVFENPHSLKKLITNAPQFIPVAVSREVEQELAAIRTKTHCIIVYPRNAAGLDVDIELEPLGHDTFRIALEKVGCTQHEIERLDNESGRSRTVLRRRLSRLDAIRTPRWAADSATARKLIPLCLAGTWNAKGPADVAILELLTGSKPYANVEQAIAHLSTIEDPPLWSVGSYRGVVSKIDALFATARHVVREDIENFLRIAHDLVLSEDDPSLDLPEENRWAAAIYNKTRDISATLRDSISETLVLLAVHGNQLFTNRTGINVENEIASLVCRLLTPLTTRKLEAHSGDLPMYAEAAPDTFLKIVERDLDSSEPQTLALMRPVDSALFGRCYRTGLLWALENIAWSPLYFPRTVRVLAQLSRVKIDDNVSNKPISSLSAIFRGWMPQTAAALETRVAALDSLVREYPDIAWQILCQQFNGEDRFGHYNHKPRWRSDACGFGDPTTNAARYAFARRALDIALDWNPHSHETLSDLVRSLNQFDTPDRDRVWQAIETWSRTASDEEKAQLRETIRVWGFSRSARLRARRQGPVPRNSDKAKVAYERLSPTDPILKHEWLFRRDWIDEAGDDEIGEEFNFDRQRASVEQKRIAALQEILDRESFAGVLRLAERGTMAFGIGFLLRARIYSQREAEDVIERLAFPTPLKEQQTQERLASGLLHAMDESDLKTAFDRLVVRESEDAIIALLKSAPFGSVTWDFVESQPSTVRARYWSGVEPRWARHQESEIIRATNELFGARRPRAAFCFSRLSLESFPKQLVFRMLKEVATSSDEQAGTYQLDSYHLKEAFKLMSSSGEITFSDLASLEYQFIDIFDREEDRIPNLEKELEQRPELFGDLVACVYKRKDAGEDPPELIASSPELVQRRATVALKVLDNIRRIPGQDEQTEAFKATKLIQWAEAAKARARFLGREDMCDFSIGKLLARSEGEGGRKWPAKPVCDAIEAIYSPSLQKGFESAVFNARGAHWRGPNGDQERELADKYARYAAAVEFTHPRVAGILREIERGYLSEAQWHDTDGRIRKRLRH